MRKVFRSIDADGDGIITKEELMQAMNSDYLDLEVLNKDVNGLMRAIDLDNSGAIDYTEFIKACIDWKEQLSTKNLLKAFRAFDTDKSGKISVEEITDILGSGGEAERSIMNNIISKYDANDDGEIDFEEFQHIMRDAFNN